MTNIAILGCGTVGTGIVEILKKRGKILKEKTGEDINIKKILVKDIKKKRNTSVDEGVLTDDFAEILEDDSIDIVIEVTSDIEESYQNIKSSINANKHIVTANKAIVSKYFEELSTLAEEKGVAFLYEASVAGGIPILKALKRQTELNEITRVQGILNGTCNYILDQMTKDNVSYGETLKKAQELGYAEADPSADVCGVDTMRKLRILSTLMMGGPVREDDIILRGIENISDLDINEFEDKDMVVRLIGEAKRDANDFTATVEPCLVDKNSYFSNVSGAYNSVTLRGEDIEELKFYGPGAGKLPTANAIMSDLLDIVLEEYSKESPLGDETVRNRNANLEANYYLRISEFDDIEDDDIDKKLNKISSELNIEEESIVVWTRKLTLKTIEEVLENVSKEKYFLAKILD